MSAIDQKKYAVTLLLTEDMLGTVPHNKEIHGTYIRDKKKALLEKEGLLTPEKIAEMELETDDVVEMDDKGYTGFFKDDKGLWVSDWMIKGFLKYAANILKGDEKAQKKKVTDYVFVFPRKIYVGVQEADGALERPLRTDGPTGQRVALAKSDTLKAGRTLSFTLTVVENVVTFAKLKRYLDYGEFQGLGQWRNAGWGRFAYTIEEIKE